MRPAHKRRILLFHPFGYKVDSVLYIKRYTGFVLIAYYLPMRKAEIIILTWQEIILKTEFIVLGGQRTKNKKPEGRFRRILRLLTS